jgi:hypothetical protein
VFDCCLCVCVYVQPAKINYKLLTGLLEERSLLQDPPVKLITTLPVSY